MFFVFFYRFMVKIEGDNGQIYNVFFINLGLLSYFVLVEICFIYFEKYKKFWVWYIVGVVYLLN